MQTKRPDLSLRDLSAPRLSEPLLRQAIHSLEEIKTRNRVRWQQGGTSKAFENRKEKFRKRIQSEKKSNVSFSDFFQNEVGWQRLLLAIYLDDLGEPWLPAFDRGIASEIFGGGEALLHSSRRRQLTGFFFRHFDLIEALDFVCERLRNSYESLVSDSDTPGDTWKRYRVFLFDPKGPSKVASDARPNETLDRLCERFAIPGEGRFTEVLRQVYLLESLKKCSYGEEPATLEQIESARTDAALECLPLGAAALQILTRRVARHPQRKWPSGWEKWIIRLGCDPRLGRASAEGSKWWGWATDEELRLAQMGVTGLTLRFFIEFLERSLQGTTKESQFVVRSQFLLALFESQKILDARLALNWSSLQRLDRRYRDSWSIAHLSATTDDTSMIVLRCTDDVFIIEGTHNFGLRAFYRNFPVRGFWERTKKTYQDHELRISPRLCPIFVQHVSTGGWVSKFFRELRYKFHIEWSEFRL
jgi:hypothetical protein